MSDPLETGAVAPIVVPLPMLNRRAVGGPVAMGLLASLVGLGLLGWLAAAVALVVAAPALAHADGGSAHVVLAAHLVALCALPPIVAGASFHLLPVMLRNDLRHPRALRAVPPLLAAGFALAPGIAFHVPAVVWPAAALVTAGLAIVVAELGGIVARAPSGRTLVASRIGVSLSLLNVVAALVLGALLFGHGDAPTAGVSHDRWLLAHLDLAVLGWLTLLIVTVGRTLAPMLAQAPAAPTRRLPLDELLLTAGTWLLVAGIAASQRPARLAGGALVVAALARFLAVMARAALRRRGPLEAPLLHLAAGVAFLVQAAVLGLGTAAGAFAPSRALTAYVVFLLLGWAASVVVGHGGKLLSLSLWVWWPPGPRPRQASLYPAGLWLAEGATCIAGVEAIGLGVLLGLETLCLAGAAVLVVSAALAAAGALRTWSARPSRAPEASAPSAA